MSKPTLSLPPSLIPPPPSGGMVSIVGAGPGAADLLTLRAYCRLQQADVVVHDRLIDYTVLALIPAHAERFYAGKAAGDHYLTQDAIHALLIEQAQQGKHVVRLKGGDPYIFGRGGEEVHALATEGIATEVVPGITAAQGCAIVAGIPLTHRDFASSCIFLPGHLAESKQNNGDKESDIAHDFYQLRWSNLVQPNQTLVFYMAIRRIQVIAQQLIAHGLPASTPAAIVQDGTRSTQAIWAAPLSQLVEQAPDYSSHPGLFIVGQVVQLSPVFQPTHSKP